MEDAMRSRQVSARERVEETLDLWGARVDVRSPQVDGRSYRVPERVELIEAPPDLDADAGASYPRLRSSLPDISSRGPLVDASENCLVPFVELAYVSDVEFPNRVLDLARRYGLLELCQH